MTYLGLGFVAGIGAEAVVAARLQHVDDLRRDFFFVENLININLKNQKQTHTHTHTRSYLQGRGVVTRRLLHHHLARLLEQEALAKLVALQDVLQGERGR